MAVPLSEHGSAWWVWAGARGGVRFNRVHAVVCCCLEMPTDTALAVTTPTSSAALAELQVHEKPLDAVRMHAQSPCTELATPLQLIMPDAAHSVHALDAKFLPETLTSQQQTSHACPTWQTHLMS
ncbi:hypothetical protein ABBQ32_005464 [Trebouxia sp. C0010 RCD-2024]